MRVVIGGKKVNLNPGDSIGKGGEADVYRWQGRMAVKVFKRPDHPDLLTPEQREAAKQKIEEHQSKLPGFPKGLPAHVVRPAELAYSARGNRIVGYAMPLVDQAEVLLRYSERPFRKNVPVNDVIAAFRDLRATVEVLHAKSVVIGDFNDLNVLVKGMEAWLIDADSFQFGKYFCRVFTEKFVDPRLCDPNAKTPRLSKPHDELSDWYALNVMLLQSLLFVHPFGGVYTPKDKTKKVPHAARPLRGITIWHPEVKYPKPATHWSVLPDEMLQHFQDVFERNKRAAFPAKLLDLRWTTCSSCGMEHARSQCPGCAKMAPVKETIQVKGVVHCTMVFRTKGRILYAAHQNGKLRWVCREGNAYKREDDTVVLRGDVGGARWRISGNRTLVGKGSKVAVLEPGKQRQISVGKYGELPVFDANGDCALWVEGGILWRENTSSAGIMADAKIRVGDILDGQTLIWAGQKFGFGFYRAGELCVSFVFDTYGKMDDNVPVRIAGQLVDSACFFADEACWFVYSALQSGKQVNVCKLVSRKGEVLASAEATAGDGSWLGKVRGKHAAGKMLFVPTDDGIIRVERDADRIVVTKHFPDTEPFVDEESRLFAGKQGLYVVDENEVRLLRID